MTQKKKKGARPAHRPSTYHKRICDDVIEHMAKGYSLTSFCTVIGVSRKQFYEWLDKYPELSDAYTHAKQACQAHWEDAGTDHLIEKTIKRTKDGDQIISTRLNPALYALQMANRFGWASSKKEEHTKIEGKVDHSHEINPVTQKELREVIELDPFLDVKKLKAKESEGGEED